MALMGSHKAAGYLFIYSFDWRVSVNAALRTSAGNIKRWRFNQLLIRAVSSSCTPPRIIRKQCGVLCTDPHDGHLSCSYVAPQEEILAGPYIWEWWRDSVNRNSWRSTSWAR